MSQKLISLLLAMSVVLNSCAHQRTKRFEAAIKEGRCDVALENIPENDDNVKFVGRANRAAGTALSYAVTGAGYTADVVLTVVGGVVIFAAIYGPVILALAASSGGGGGSVSALTPLPLDLSEVPRPTMGKEAYKGTEEWRCPDLTALSRSVRKVADCHAKSDLAEGKLNALTTLNSLKKNKDFMNCIVKAERETILADVLKLENEIALAK